MAQPAVGPATVVCCVWIIGVRVNCVTACSGTIDFNTGLWPSLEGGIVNHGPSLMRALKSWVRVMCLIVAITLVLDVARE